MPKNTVTASRPRKTGQTIPKLDPTYWQTLGYNDIEEVAGILIITLSPGVLLEDRGDALTLRSDGPPTADQSRIMVEAARARGWQGIRFTGGTPEWQRQARIEAIRQGFDPADIELECEPNKPPVIMPMPDHLRRRLVPTPPEEPAPAAPVPVSEAPAPVPAMREETKLALVVSSLFRDCSPHKPRGCIMWPGKRDMLLADRPLAVYFAAVIDGGEEAWQQERMMMGRRLLRLPREHRGDPMSLGAIEVMLPTWRSWGQILIEAGVIPDLEGVFIPPGGYH